MDANPCVKKKICCCSLIKWKYLNWNIWERKIIFNLKEIEIGIVDRGLEVALSDCPNILSYLPIRQLNCLYEWTWSGHATSYHTLHLDLLPCSEEGVGIWPTKGNRITCYFLHCLIFQLLAHIYCYRLWRLYTFIFCVNAETLKLICEQLDGIMKYWICVYTLKLVHTDDWYGQKDELTS